MVTLGDFEFEAAQFLDYLQPVFSSLFVLLKEAKECDTKVGILGWDYGFHTFCMMPSLFFVRTSPTISNQTYSSLLDVRFEHNVIDSG